jgi:hypothetical protein
MSTDPIISLIFVNYRSAWYLAMALESLFSLERESAVFEIIVVNNDSSESAELQALKQRFPFFLIESGENSGFGRGNNRGVSHARGSILGFINPDIMWTGAHLRRIVDFFNENSRAGVLGMTLIDTNKRPEPWSTGEYPSLASLFLNNLFPPRGRFRADQKFFFPDWVSGGALFIRKKLFAEIGGFDERFFLYFEDIDLCKAVRRRGFSVVCHTDFPLVHLGGKSQTSGRLQKKHFSLSQREYFRKHRPKWESGVLECLQFLFRKV